MIKVIINLLNTFILQGNFMNKHKAFDDHHKKDDSYTDGFFNVSQLIALAALTVAICTDGWKGLMVLLTGSSIAIVFNKVFYPHEKLLESHDNHLDDDSLSPQLMGDQHDHGGE